MMRDAAGQPLADAKRLANWFCDACHIAPEPVTCLYESGCRFAFFLLTFYRALAPEEQDPYHVLVRKAATAARPHECLPIAQRRGDDLPESHPQAETNVASTHGLVTHNAPDVMDRQTPNR